MFKYLSGNLNIEELSIIIFESINTYNNIGIIDIIEDNSNNNNNLLERNKFIMINIKCCKNSYSGTVLYYGYSNKLSYNIAIYNSKFIDNLELLLHNNYKLNLILNSIPMIVIKEDGTDIDFIQLPYYPSSFINTINNAHFYIQDVLFLRNEYLQTNTYQYYAKIYITITNMTNNEPVSIFAPIYFSTRFPIYSQMQPPVLLSIYTVAHSALMNISTVIPNILTIILLYKHTYVMKDCYQV